MPLQLGGQVVDLRVVADGGAHQPDLGLTPGDGTFGRGQQAVERLLARRPIDIAGQAEAAAAAAAAGDLHQVHVGELGVGSVERAGRVVVGQVAHPAALHLAKGDVIPVGWAQRRHVPARGAIQFGQEGIVFVHALFVAGRPAEFHQVRHGLFAFADQDGVKDRRHRFGVHRHAGAAGNQQRPRPPVPLARALAVGRARGNAGLAQHLDDVEVVHLPRDGKGPHVELVGRALALDRLERFAGQGAALFPEDALADDVGLGVEHAVEQLQGEAAHADKIGRGHAEGDTQPPAPIFIDGAAFRARSRLCLAVGERPRAFWLDFFMAASISRIALCCP